jgi:hypothetical protein
LGRKLAAPWTVEDDPDFVAVALFSALGLLASFYFMTHVPIESFFFS